MPGFNSKHYGEVRFYNGSCSAERKDGRIIPVLLSAEPLKPGELWTIKPKETKRWIIQNRLNAVLGVTGHDPASLRTIPDDARRLPQSRVQDGSSLYTDGKHTSECPPLSLSQGDTYGVSWSPGRVTFYHNRSVHYTWDVDTPDTPHVWGVVEMWLLKQISVVEADPVTLKFACMHLIKEKVGSDVIQELDIPSSLIQDIKQLYCVNKE